MNADALGRRAEAMLAELGAISDGPDRLMRLFLSPAHARAVALVSGWMAAAGLGVRTDSVATVHGLLNGTTPATKRLLVGSHIDTVVDAGKYDGALGVVAGILAAAEIRARSIAMPFGLEVLAFGDEEGVRFPKTLTSSLAIAGAFDRTALDATDRDGTTLRSALAAFGGDPGRIPGEAYRREDVLGYVEVHIEQGPVLDGADEALGVVSAIAGQSRHRARVTGQAGHAGTVPMAMRRDALAAAAEMVLAIESIARAGKASLVATVGHVEVAPGAVNVVPGAATFTLDVRAADDAVRTGAVAEIRRQCQAIASRRKVDVQIDAVHEKPVTIAAPSLKQTIAAAIADVTGKAPREMMSGAGHDGQAMAGLTDIGMIFVRCRGGISHNPAEYASPADIGLAIEALIGTIVRMANGLAGNVATL